jgi:hypothetical protein
VTEHRLLACAFARRRGAARASILGVANADVNGGGMRRPRCARRSSAGIARPPWRLWRICAASWAERGRGARAGRPARPGRRPTDACSGRSQKIAETSAASEATHFRVGHALLAPGAERDAHGRATLRARGVGELGERLRELRQLRGRAASPRSAGPVDEGHREPAPRQDRAGSTRPASPAPALATSQSSGAEKSRSSSAAGSYFGGWEEIFRRRGRSLPSIRHPEGNARDLEGFSERIAAARRLHAGYPG